MKANIQRSAKASKRRKIHTKQRGSTLDPQYHRVVLLSHIDGQHGTVPFHDKNMPSEDLTELEGLIPTFGLDSGQFIEAPMSWTGSTPVSCCSPKGVEIGLSAEATDAGSTFVSIGRPHISDVRVTRGGASASSFVDTIKEPSETLSKIDALKHYSECLDIALKAWFSEYTGPRYTDNIMTKEQHIQSARQHFLNLWIENHGPITPEDRWEFAAWCRDKERGEPVDNGHRLTVAAHNGGPGPVVNRTVGKIYRELHDDSQNQKIDTLQKEASASKQAGPTVASPPAYLKDAPDRRIMKRLGDKFKAILFGK